MPLKTLAEIEDALRRADLSSLVPMNIAVLRNVVVEPIEPYLRYLASEIGHQARVQFGEYDQVLQEAAGSRPEWLNEKTTCVLVFVALDVLSWNLARNFAALSAADVGREVDQVGEFIDAVLAGLRRQTPAMILWHSFELPVAPALGILDGQRADGQTAVVTRLNERLRAALGAAGSAYLVDMNACRSRIGAAAFRDSRYWHIGRAPYSREALREIALEDFKFLRALKGRQKKCLVLDCDDILWGGVVGEDGLSGIKLGRTYPGSPYVELQQEIVNLHHRGVILAVCSKNNAADVWDVFRNHPDMLLREEHIAAARINWVDKVTNLRELAAELNIGLDSMLFVDDSEIECELIRNVLPEVEVLHLPRDKAVEHRERLAAGGWFDTLTLSDEDRLRAASYKAEAARTKLRGDSPDLESYFRSLEMVVRILPADPVSIPRLAQLTQKTNQFNMTTRRYSDEHIARLAASESTDVLGLRLTDRFGDAGLVGVGILRYDGAAAVMDTFLLSCRVLGRGVEDAFLVQCLRRAQARGARTIAAQFIPTAKNQVAADFYRSRGFQPIDGPDEGQRLELSLETFSGSAPSFFKRIETFEDLTPAKE
jgi:FkbH-like protein